MVMRKYGTGEVIGVDEDGTLSKTAKQGWTTEDEQELREETPERVQDGADGVS